MTATILDPQLLERQLTRSRTPHGFATRFHRRLAAVTDACWTLAAAADLRFPTTNGGPATLKQRIIGSYLPHVLTAGAHDPGIHDTFRKVLNTIASATTLFGPPNLRAVIRHGRATAHD